MNLFGRGQRRPDAVRIPPEQEAALTAQRNAMVYEQIQRRGITDVRVLDVMRTIPRHLFLPLEWMDHAYEDRPLDIGQGQTISQPYMVALMTQLLELKPSDNVLEIGTGSGYQCAVLAKLAARVVSIERVEKLAERAAAALHDAGVDNATVLIGDGSRGRPESGSYDAIIVTAAAPHIPSSLKSQLADGGRLVCPTGSRETQELIRLTRAGESFREERGTPCVFVPLIGAEAWSP